MHAKYIHRDSRLHIHDVSNIYRTRQDLLSPLLDVHVIEKMRRRQDHHIHSLTLRLPLHLVVAEDEDDDKVVEIDVHYLVCIIEILVLI